MASLAVNTQSRHYKYYSWLRRMYGCEDSSKPTSLCPYCQTIIWGSVCGVVLFIPMIIGWISMKIGRYSCKIENSYFDSFLAWLGGKTEAINYLNEGPNSFKKSPLLAGLAFCIFGLGSVLLIGASIFFVGTIVALISKGLWNIEEVAKAIFLAVCWIGWFLCHGFYYVGFVVDFICGEVAWFFTNKPLWILIGDWALWSLKWLAALSAVSIALGFLAMGVSRLTTFQRFSGWLVTTFNGYSEAQDQRKVRLKSVVKKPTTWTCEYCSYENDKGIACGNCWKSRPEVKIEYGPILKFIHGAIDFFVYTPGRGISNAFVKVRDKKLFVLSSGSIVMEYIYAVKSGICPIVEFVDPEQIRSEAQEAAQEKMATEKKLDDQLNHEEFDPNHHEVGGEG